MNGIIIPLLANAATCPVCGQRAGVRNGTINIHQKPGGGTCPGSGSPV
ncbi:hypothetical protein [Parafrankia discariae]|nr:hypothetical protein [Parafrankia discariae]